MKRDLGFSSDLRIYLALRDARAAENAAARAQVLANHELVAKLRRIAKRRGQSDVDWPGYFRNAGINYP